MEVNVNVYYVRLFLENCVKKMGRIVYVYYICGFIYFVCIIFEENCNIKLIILCLFGILLF